MKAKMEVVRPVPLAKYHWVGNQPNAAVLDAPSAGIQYALTVFQLYAQ
jgi:hypothetical protein